MKHHRLFALSLALLSVLLLSWGLVRVGSAPSAAKTTDPALPPNAVPSGPSDWPQWRGPERNGLSKDTGLLKQWSSPGPQQVWSISNLGEGYGSVAIKGDRVYVQG